MCEISLRNWANHSSVKCVSYGMFEPEMRTCLHFEAKQIQFALELHHMICRKKVVLLGHNYMTI